MIVNVPDPLTYVPMVVAPRTTLPELKLSVPVAENWSLLLVEPLRLRVRVAPSKLSAPDSSVSKIVTSLSSTTEGPSSVKLTVPPSVPPKVGTWFELTAIVDSTMFERALNESRTKKMKERSPSVGVPLCS